MAEGDRSHDQEASSPPLVGAAVATPTRAAGRWLRRTTAALVCLVLAAAGAAYAYDLGPRLGWTQTTTGDAAGLQPPTALTLPEPRTAGLVAAPAELGVADVAAIRRAVGRLLRSQELGPRVAVAVGSAGGGAPELRLGVQTVVPASTLKLLTTAAALSALGPDHTFETSVSLADGPAAGGPGVLTLVGGGDPLLARSTEDREGYPEVADLTTLARDTALTLQATPRTAVRLRYDASLFTGPVASRQWEANYLPDDVVSPISPLWADEGRVSAQSFERSPDPAEAAARYFARALRRAGVQVRGVPAPAAAPEGALVVAHVESAPLAQIVQHTLEVSDNEAAEVLARHVAIASGRPATFAGATRAIEDVLAGLGVDLTGARLYDGSGLSRQDRLDPATLLDVLVLAADPGHPELRTVASGLPVAGFSGSLAYRFAEADPAALGRVRAKTGTLTGVHGLAGLVTTADGVTLAFAVVADRVDLVDTLAARDRLDDLAAALAACTCAQTPGLG